MQLNTRETFPTSFANSRTARIRRRRGQTLVEYALIIAVIAVVAIGVLLTLGQQTKSLFSVITSQVSRAGSA